MIAKDNIDLVNKLDFSAVSAASIRKFWLQLASNGIGQPIFAPVIVARGIKDGPVLGVTAAIHGNELNGLSVIQRLFNDIEVKELRGTIVGVPVLNVPSILTHERRFLDGEDLNRIMPGQADGNRSEQYAHQIMEKIIRHFDYLMDLHTASFGRVNSYYIRANLSSPETLRMAALQNAQIILNNEAKDGTLRSAASDLGIQSITIEVGDPNRFQKGMIRSSLTGIYNLLCELDMIDDEIEPPGKPSIYCKRSYWIYADEGGIMVVKPSIAETVKKGDEIATLRNVFGDVIKNYYAPEDGIVIGKSVLPVSQTGGRIIHLGIVDQELSRGAERGSLM